jgi:hypothetical protein
VRWWHGKAPQSVADLTVEQVERWRDGDETVRDERIPGLLDRLVQPRASRQAEPELEAG